MSKRTWIRSSLLMLTVVTVGIVPRFTLIAKYKSALHEGGYIASNGGERNFSNSKSDSFNKASAGKRSAGFSNDGHSIDVIDTRYQDDAPYIDINHTKRLEVVPEYYNKSELVAAENLITENGTDVVDNAGIIDTLNENFTNAVHASDFVNIGNKTADAVNSPRSERGVRRTHKN